MSLSPLLPLRAEYDVAVVGLGPIGGTLANLLALRGLAVLVLDREADIYNLPRAVQFDGECMRVFQTIGIAAEMSPHLLRCRGCGLLMRKAISSSTGRATDGSGAAWLACQLPFPSAGFGNSFAPPPRTLSQSGCPLAA